MSCRNISELIVEQGLCIGCGACITQCDNQSLKMQWNEDGFLTPRQLKKCDCSGACLQVCPFNTKPDADVRTEDELSKKYIYDGIQKHDPQVGHYINTYVGYSQVHRQNSSSGGIATYFLEKLLEQGIVDHVVCVSRSGTEGEHYEYGVFNSVDKVRSSSKTRYYPVSLGNALESILTLEGKVAIVGVACFIKAVRLLQHNDQRYKDKIGFTVGIICGGVKSRHYTDYLAEKSGASRHNYMSPEYRIKSVDTSASDYSFSCISEEKEKSIRMNKLGDMWGSGLFKAKACDFCDDVTTELADISLGDAWVKPYSDDGQGHNVIIIRTQLANDIFSEGIERKSLIVDEVPVEKVVETQRGSFNHRRVGLKYRTQAYKLKETPPKRFAQTDIPASLKLVHYMRMVTRSQSLKLWKKSSDAQVFEKKIYYIREILIFVTRFNRKKESILKKIRNKK